MQGKSGGYSNVGENVGEELKKAATLLIV